MDQHLASVLRFRPLDALVIVVFPAGACAVAAVPLFFGLELANALAFYFCSAPMALFAGSLIAWAWLSGRWVGHVEGLYDATRSVARLLVVDSSKVSAGAAVDEAELRDLLDDAVTRVVGPLSTQVVEETYGSAVAALYASLAIRALRRCLNAVQPRRVLAGAGELGRGLEDWLSSIEVEVRAWLGRAQLLRRIVIGVGAALVLTATVVLALA